MFWCNYQGGAIIENWPQINSQTQSYQQWNNVYLKITFHWDEEKYLTTIEETILADIDCYVSVVLVKEPLQLLVDIVPLKSVAENWSISVEIVVQAEVSEWCKVSDQQTW